MYVEGSAARQLYDDTEYTPRLDANNDDEISIADVNAIRNEILYGNH